MEFAAAVSNVESKEDMIIFIQNMRQNLVDHKDQWENSSLEGFLEAMSACLHDMDGYYYNNSQRIPSKIPWDFFAKILLAARIYE